MTGLTLRFRRGQWKQRGNKTARHHPVHANSLSVSSDIGTYGLGGPPMDDNKIPVSSM